ncbi:dehydrogenase/reductase SDR family member on chromosome X-like isoform X1 [Takifugu flavidus]|uniref:Dehydrogenase/reductase SDR family member on chromosome X n=2 Tax=Takifugu flavidus TaxID=433684 RepID=A0A5C6PP83_9TELE|nr:dehydrogenase/reductase SDR family member on chromosome X-like isoform X1 [Takifugu flavidus]TWW80651.1 Dehydrogenase/reductase SDR family member on chromosome X [Takifugu flavidus]
MLSFVRVHLVPALKLYLLGFKVLLTQLFSKSFRLPVMPRQDGKVVIVTGGARGIGYEVVRLMVGLGAHVIIGGRDEQEGPAAVKRILREHRQAKVEFMKLDLASLQSIRDFVASFKERKLPLNILVNNAGVMLVPEGRTVDGFEQHFGVNYLGHFLLTWLLLDILKDCGKCGFFSRVVNVSSSAHRIGEIRLNNLNICQYYSAHAAYCNSKLAQVLFSSYLHQELQGGGFSVSSCAVDPGMVDTALYRHLWTPLWLPLSIIAHLLFRTPEEGAAPVLHAALSPALEGECGGGYWASGHKEMTTPPTHDPQLQHSLWETSLHLLGLQ